MTRSFTSLLFIAALAACGSKAAAPSTLPGEPGGSAATAERQPPASGVATQAPAAAPEQPAEPVSGGDPPNAGPPKSDPAKLAADLVVAETAAWETAKPVFQRACATCHTRDGKKAAKKKLDHFDLGSYPPGGHHTATIGFTIRDVLGITGKKPTMPYDRPGSVTGDDLAAIKAWTDAWEAAEQAGAHPHAGDHHH